MSDGLVLPERRHADGLRGRGRLFDELRQRRWELERADDAARVLAERLEMADRPADVAIIRELRVRLADHRASASPEQPARS